MTPDELWLAAMWPPVRRELPAPPATVVEIGCGQLGGFVPMLRQAGYDAVGIDPAAPEGPWYRRVEFESHRLTEPVRAVVACTSLHHVHDVGAALDLVTSALTPGGSVVVVEWARERFDQATALWCFGRLPPGDGEPGWLQRCHDEWRASQLPWDAYSRAWAEEEGLQAGQDIVRELDARFVRQVLTYGPYFFPDLAGVSPADEQAAIDAGKIQANGIFFAGQRQ